MTPQPNQDQLFITRKRKKWKFAHFDQWPNCFQASGVTPQLWQGKKLVLEIGAGSGDLSLGLARRQPDKHFVAIDIKSDRLYTGAKIALQEKLDNISFVRANIDQVTELFAVHSAHELWVTFPDPFDRKKQAKHRLTHPHFLRLYQQLLMRDGILYFKTDNRQLFLWSLEQLVSQHWQIAQLNFDLHDSDLADHYKITTYYERKFMNEGIIINFVACTPPA